MKSVWTMIQTEQKRRAFLKAGRRLLAHNKSISDLKVGDIVREANLAQGSFYNYFRDKEGYMIEFVEDLFQPVRVETAAARRTARSAHELCDKQFSTICRIFETDHDVARLISANLSELREYYYTPKSFLPDFEDIIEVLEEGTKSGYWRQCDFERLSYLLISCSLELMEKSSYSPHDIRERATFMTSVVSKYFEA